MLHQALSLCSSLVEEDLRLEAAFFESVRVLVLRLMNTGGDKRISLPEMNARINELLKRFIPLISAALGAVLGLVAYYAVPSIIPAANVCVALLIGGASGLTATGTNQIIKQLGKKDEDNDTE